VVNPVQTPPGAEPSLLAADPLHGSSRFPQPGEALHARARGERKKHMPQTLRSQAEAAPICAHCRVEMVEVFVRTIQFDGGNEDITYRCEECGAHQTRTTKPTWSV
jgi:hypothetical protein